MKGFKQFILRGNVLDLAVAVVMGAAFTAVVTALVKDLLTPIVGALIGQPDFSALTVDVNGSKLLIGDFMNAVIAFLMLAAAVYFFIVLPVNTLVARMRRCVAPPLNTPGIRGRRALPSGRRAPRSGPRSTWTGHYGPVRRCSARD